MTGVAHLKIDLDGFNGADSPPLGAWTRVLLDPQADVTDPAADKVYVGRVSVSLGSDGRPTTANGTAVDPAIGVPLLAGVTYAVSSTALRTTGTVGPLTEGQTYNLADVYVPGAPLTPDQAAALTARIVALEGARKSIRDFLKPVQIDSDAATLAQVDDPASFIASPGSVVWDNYAAIGYPAGNPVPVTPGTPYSPGCRLFTTGGGNVQSLPMSFYANGKIGIHVTLWADTDVWVSIDGRPVSADPFIIRQADTATFHDPDHGARGSTQVDTRLPQAGSD